jgi:hypothetical protein
MGAINTKNNNLLPVLICNKKNDPEKVTVPVFCKQQRLLTIVFAISFYVFWLRHFLASDL